ncbi:hypothetical protein ACLKA7_015700 [Drosophila subpalustris]
MAEPNNNMNVDFNYNENSSSETDNEDMFSDTETEDECSCVTAPVEGVETQDASTTSGDSSSSSDDSNHSWNEAEYEEPSFYVQVFQEAGQPAADNADNNAMETDVALPTASQANDSGLDLRPVPASIDLTRTQPSANWQEYHAHVRASTRRLPLPDNRNRSAAPAVRRRLCGGQPTNRPCLVPIGIDPDYGGILYIRNDTDSEEEQPLPPLAMVPRRGNSVSDLSQCSSEEETVQPNGEQRQ